MRFKSAKVKEMKVDRIKLMKNSLNQDETCYSRLSLSRTPRDSMKDFEISVLRHIRFAGMRKTINQTTTFNRMNK